MFLNQDNGLVGIYSRCVPTSYYTLNVISSNEWNERVIITTILLCVAL